MSLEQFTDESGYITRETKVELDAIVVEVTKQMDFEFDGTTTTKIKNLMPHEVPKEYGIGLIVGPSGSGKSTILRNFGIEKEVKWEHNKAIASHFDSVEDAQERLGAVGFNSVPHWAKPFHSLSNGQQFRANLARSLVDNTVIDEFTSVVDRNVAISCSKSIRKYVDRTGIKGLVFASCHYDIIEWLQPDWVFDVSNEQLIIRGSERRFPAIALDITPVSAKAYSDLGFADHHYLSREINVASHCYLMKWGDVPVGFVSILPLPSGTVKDAWIAHRLVVLPDFQGMGIGPKMTEAVAYQLLARGKRFYTRTTNHKLGEYHERSIKWKATSSNRTPVTPNKMMKHSVDPKFVKDRVSYSHEFIGVPSELEAYKKAIEAHDKENAKSGLDFMFGI